MAMHIPLDSLDTSNQSAKITCTKHQRGLLLSFLTGYKSEWFFYENGKAVLDNDQADERVENLIDKLSQ